MDAEVSHGRPFTAGLAIDCLASSFDEMDGQAAYWRVRSSQLEAGRYSGRLLAVHTAAMQLARSWRSLGTRIEGCVPVGTVAIGLPISRQTPIQHRGRVLAGNAAIVQDSTSELDFSFAGAIDILTISVDSSEFERRARALWKEEPARRRATGTLFFGSPESRTEVAGMLGRMVGNASIRAPGLASAENSRRLENAVLDRMLAAAEPSARAEGTRSRQRSARVAKEYLHAHCREPVSIADLCALTGASRRSLHLGFLELYGVPPMRYLLALRLSGVRKELTSPAVRRITDVATAWGFDHLGRFSAAYREFFGQSPSSAQRQSRGAAWAEKFCASPESLQSRLEAEREKESGGVNLKRSAEPSFTNRGDGYS